MRRAPPVTSAAFGNGGAEAAPVGSSLPAGSAAGTAFLAAGPHLRPHHLARRDAGAAGGGAAAYARRDAVRYLGRQAELDLFEPPDLVAQPRRLLEFEIG